MTVTKSNKKKTANKPPFQWSFSLPTAMLIGGVLLVFASFLPLGDWAAKKQWTPEDSAKFDEISFEYKKSAYRSPEQTGLSQDELDAQHKKMRQQMEAWQLKLERAQSQPQRWSRYLLGIGVLLVAAGFFANNLGR